MSNLAIDLDDARRHAARLAAEGDDAFAGVHALRSRLDHLMLETEGFGARRALEQAATTAWELATVLHLVVEAVIAGDRVDLTDANAIDELVTLAAADLGHGGDAGSACGGGTSRRVLFDASPIDGDLGGTSARELRSPFIAVGNDPLARGRSLVMRALADAGNAAQIHPDEFELVRLADDRFVVVLPGVTDLSTPDPSWNERHRSVRDLDQAAIGSYGSTGVAGNPYAQMVVEGLRAANVPRGAELLVVGHSFGADTALDLAADPTVNGVDVRITHVVAAGNSSGPQLSGVPTTTQVLVLQNHRDVPVIVEGIGQSDSVEAIGAGLESIGHLMTGDGSAGVDALAESGRHWSAAIRNAGRAITARTDELATLVVDLGRRDWDAARIDLVDIVGLTTRVERLGTNRVVDVFAGGADGAGHHPSNYVEHVATTDHEAVTEFFESLDVAGFASTGSAVAIDVSVPTA